jgi:hypothetical protein
MDFCLRVFQEACSDLGLPSHEGTWTAYADDVADKSLSEDEASKALQQLEAASAFVGLRLNVSKTEVMAKGIKKATVSAGKPATKERVAVTFNKKGIKHGVSEGWMVEAKHAHHVTETKVDTGNLAMTSTILVQFDDGEHMVAELRGENGWIRDRTGLNHRLRKLGFVTFLDKKDKPKHVCEGCGTSFDSEIALKTHHGGRWCRKFEDMSIKEQIRLRRFSADM